MRRDDFCWLDKAPADSNPCRVTAVHSLWVILSCVCVEVLWIMTKQKVDIIGRGL